MKYNIVGIIACLLMSSYSNAQKSRFLGEYVLAQPSSALEHKEDFQKTMTAMLGGVKILESPNTPKSRSDAEAFVVDDYKASLADMADYAKKMGEKSGKDKSSEIDKISKAIKSSKYAAATADLLSLGAKSTAKNELQFFIWKDYIGDIKAEMPWVNPKNIKVTFYYRSMLDYMSKNYERPFGVKAELGAVVADGAQALSNCLESPKDLEWAGESRMKMNEGDQLRRLASIVAYYDWRRHEKSSGKRTAHISPEIVRKLQKSLYDIVRSILKRKTAWDADPAHGRNLLNLFEATLSNGWSVNGDKAQKKEGE